MENSQQIPDSITKFRSAIADHIKDFTRGRDGPLHEMVRYHLGFENDPDNPGLQGKAIRSSLLLFTTEGLDGNWKDAVPAAISLELIHNFSLVHDDIQDDDCLRRGRESVQAKWGAKQAINAGDALRDLSTLALVELGDSADSERTMNATEIIGNYTLDMISGQVRDLQLTTEQDISMEDYLEMIGKKTCALLKASFHLGGLYAGVDDNTVDRLKTIGQHLGYIFQIRDDWLGIWGERDKFGKSVKSDLVEKKRSFPVVYALQNLPGTEKEEFQQIYFSTGKLSPEKVSRAKELLDKSEVKAGTTEWVREYWKETKKEIKKVDFLDWAQSDLFKFGEYLLTRER